MKRRSSYKNVRVAIDQRDILSFDELFAHMDQRALFKKARMNPYSPEQKRIDDPRAFTIEEVYQLAAVLGVSGLKLLEMIDYDIGGWVKLIYC